MILSTPAWTAFYDAAIKSDPTLSICNNLDVKIFDKWTKNCRDNGLHTAMDIANDSPFVFILLAMAPNKVKILHQFALQSHQPVLPLQTIHPFDGLHTLRQCGQTSL